MALMNVIIGYYETGTDHSVALNQMHLLGLNLEGKTQKDLTEFVKKANYILHGLKPADKPAEATMYSWLWHQIKRVPMLSRMVDKVKSSARNSRKRSFEWIWIQIAEEIRERRHDSNYENVSNNLSSLLHPISLHSLPQKRSLHPTQVEKETNLQSLQNLQRIPQLLLERYQMILQELKTEKRHAAGHCRFGERCRNLHTGEPGSEAARKAFSEYQSAKGGKGDKGKGRRRVTRKVESDLSPTYPLQQLLLRLHRR